MEPDNLLPQDKALSLPDSPPQRSKPSPQDSLSPEVQEMFKRGEQMGGMLMLKQLLESLQKFPLRKKPAPVQKT